MKLFECQNCSNLLYFENASCAKCSCHTGYLPAREIVSAVKPDGDRWIALVDPDGRYRFCANWERHACNWLIEATSETIYCRACQHNRTVPSFADHKSHSLWVLMETAKRRLFYSLIKLRLPLPLPNSGDGESLEFDFLTEHTGHKVFTGHDSGTITIALSEADDAKREQLRTNMHEPYRTLLGHFRHEVGHFYWDCLVRDRDRIESFRAVFGDESEDYGVALERYYAAGPPTDWQENFVSAYATMHPWEDFAESWAHYLHIVDTLEMGFAFGISVAPRLGPDHGLHTSINRNPYAMSSIEELMAEWLPLSFAVNSINRTMGQPDLYPFVISPVAARKLDYIREIVQSSRLV
jgi:hypothetical protein